MEVLRDRSGGMVELATYVLHASSCVYVLYITMLTSWCYIIEKAV